jgi:hypothetical protein
MSLICLCNLQGQVWTKLIDSAAMTPCHFYCAVEDTNTNILYLGGDIHDLNQYTTKGIVKFDGTYFDTLSSGLDDFAKNYVSLTIVRSMQMFQNKLYVFGDFSKTGKYYCNNIGRWNGSDWDTVNFNPQGTVWFSAVHNNELYVAGSFSAIGGIPCNSIAKYDGTNWYDLGHPISPNEITAFTVFQGRPYIAGQVTPASSSANLSYYDGTQWVPWVGVSGSNTKYVAGMTVIDSMLFVYGRFNSIAGTNCRGLAAYNGKNWYGLGQGLSNSDWETIYNVQKINGEIYVTGIFDKIEGIGNSALPKKATNMVKFDGERWCLVSPPFDNNVLGLVRYKNDLYVYGAFWQPENDSLNGFARYNGGYSPGMCSPTINILMSTVGISEQIAIGNLRVYPNPVKEKLTIEWVDFDPYKVNISIYNTVGHAVINISDAKSQQEVDLNKLPSGIYFIKVQEGKEQRTFKILKE